MATSVSAFNRTQNFCPQQVFKRYLENYSKRRILLNLKEVLKENEGCNYYEKLNLMTPDGNSSFIGVQLVIYP